MKKELFDEWSSYYNKTIQESERNNTYPFAGYSKIQKYIYDEVSKLDNPRILEMGIGTGMMTKKLYNLGFSITGVDFSSKMIEEAEKIMPNNTYINLGFEESLSKLVGLYDVVIFSYSIHHITREAQIELINILTNHLTKNGFIIIGDVSTKTFKEMEVLRLDNLDIWDDEEYYPIADSYSLLENYTVEFQKVSFCSGILTLVNK